MTSTVNLIVLLLFALGLFVAGFFIDDPFVRPMSFLTFMILISTATILSRIDEKIKELLHKKDKEK